MLEHGGAVGEALYWAATTLFQRLGAHIIALLMLVSRSAAADRKHRRRGARRDGTGAAQRAGTGTREVAAHRPHPAPRREPEPAGRTRPGEEIAITRADPTEPITSELERRG